MVGVGLRKSRQKAPSCRLEIMLIGAGLGVWGINGEFQGKCQLGGIYGGLYLGKDGIVDQIGVVGTGFQCEPGICLSKIELRVGMGWFFRVWI